MRKQPGLRTSVLADTGPLVSLLSAKDRYNGWVMEQLGTMKLPLITCEAVLTEAAHMVRHMPHGRSSLLEMLNDGFLIVGMDISKEAGSLLALVKRYASVPMSLADACMVRLAELNPQSELWTLDSDFSVYRKNGRHVISLITP